jgi:N-acyl-D-aspartate/D-glutamate deacylase
MPYDLVIKNGTVIDGSGLPRYRADIGVRHGRIEAIGRIRERAREVLDADGQVVSPGFVDGHTHMDAQVFWDPLGTSSCWHGITSVVMGNCGFTLAPCAAADKAMVVRNLQRAEDISPEAMEAGIRWQWTTFPEFLDTLQSLPKGINYSGYIGHSALRTYVMGERAFGQPATGTTSGPWSGRSATPSGPGPWASPPRARRLTRPPTTGPWPAAPPAGMRCVAWWG